MDSLLWLPPVLIGTPVIVALGIALYIVRDGIIDWSREMKERWDTPMPLPKIDQVDKLVEEYIWEHSRMPGVSPKRKVHHEDHMDWMLEYNALLSTLETARFYKEYMGRPIADAPALGFKTEAPIPGFRPENLEKSLLEQIQALTARYGFDHPRTQRVVQFHEERMNLHKRNWEKWSKKND